MDWQFIHIENEDIDWGVAMSNFLARTSCNLLLDDVVDEQQTKAQEKIMTALRHSDEVVARNLGRAHQKITSAQFRAAARSLEAAGVIEVEIIKPTKGGREKVVYKKKQTLSDTTS